MRTSDLTIMVGSLLIMPFFPFLPVLLSSDSSRLIFIRWFLFPTPLENKGLRCQSLTTETAKNTFRMHQKFFSRLLFYHIENISYPRKQKTLTWPLFFFFSWTFIIPTFINICICKSNIYRLHLLNILFKVTCLQ